MKPTTPSSDWASRGYSCDVWTDPPGRAWNDFVHDTDELLMLIEGKLEISVADQPWQPAIGQEVHIPAGVQHSVHNVGSTTNRWSYGYKTL